MSSKARFLRELRRAVLIVGEGHAEVVFLQHCKSLYTFRSGGITVNIKNAHGKGAGNVVDYAVKQNRLATYDACYALLDSDTDWTQAVAKRAKSNRVQILLAVPCLEALLLEVHAQPIVGNNTQQLKTQFKSYFGGAEANDLTLYERRFGREILDLAALRLPLLQSILAVFKVDS